MHDSCVARARPSARCRCRTRAGGQPTGASEGAGGSNLNYFTYGLIGISKRNEDVCSVNHERDKGIKVDF